MKLQVKRATEQTLRWPTMKCRPSLSCTCRPATGVRILLTLVVAIQQHYHRPPSPKPPLATHRLHHLLRSITSRQLHSKSLRSNSYVRNAYRVSVSFGRRSKRSHTSPGKEFRSPMGGTATVVILESNQPVTPDEQ